MFEDDVATIDVPEAPKTFKKTRVVRPFFSSTTRMPKNTNSGNPAGLRWQRRNRTADNCKEITSSHRLRLDHVGSRDQNTPPTSTIAQPVRLLIVPADIPTPCAINSGGPSTVTRHLPHPVPSSLVSYIDGVTPARARNSRRCTSALASSTLLWCGRCKTPSKRSSFILILAPEIGSSDTPTCLSNDSMSRQRMLPLGGSWKMDRIRFAW